MTPIEFPGVNVTYAKDQPEYLPLPVMKLPDGMVISCWKFTPEELAEVNKTGCMFISQMTFNQPLQPILPVADLGDLIQLIEG